MKLLVEDCDNDPADIHGFSVDMGYLKDYSGNGFGDGRSESGIESDNRQHNGDGHGNGNGRSDLTDYKAMKP